MSTELSKFRIVIASIPDRENCVCEIYYDHIQWVEISHEDEDMKIQFYSNPEKNYWEFSLETALTVLEQAKKKFLGSK